LAITDGETVYSVPWTSTFRYYSRVEQSFWARTLNTLTKTFPPLELLPILEPKSINTYIDDRAICEESKITHLVILERGVTSVQEETVKEVHRKIINLNRFEFNYLKAPLLVAYEFFNPSLNIAAASEAESNILQKVVERAKSRLIVRTNNPTNYASLVLDALK